MSIKVSHEVPISLLAKSRLFSDYDYCLVHLLPQYPEYFDFFVESLEMGREVILDCSIFELGTAFDTEKYVEWIKKLKPTYYIIPDVLEKGIETVKNAQKFIKTYPDLPGTAIAVAQGSTYVELVYCYKSLNELGIPFLALSFDYSFLQEMVKGVFPDKYPKMMLGRQMVLEKMLKEGIINTSKPHHLLGNSLPQEGKFYKEKGWEWIYSVDSSNPVVHGIKRQRYKDFGLMSKESIKLADLIEHKVTDEELDDILHNVMKYKTFWK